MEKTSGTHLESPKVHIERAAPSNHLEPSERNHSLASHFISQTERFLYLIVHHDVSIRRFPWQHRLDSDMVQASKEEEATPTIGANVDVYMCRQLLLFL